jgi:hypothetical protein
VLGYCRIPLPDVAGVGEYCAQRAHLRIRKLMLALQCLEQRFVLLRQRLRWTRERIRRSQDKREQKQ